MTRLARRVARKRVLPIATVAGVLLVIGVSFWPGTRGTGSDSFAFNVYWPQPSQYLPGNQVPNAYLQINYTGGGEATYSYAVYDGSYVLAHETVNVTSGFPCSIYIVAPVPSVLQAQVSRNGALVYEQNLTLG